MCLLYHSPSFFFNDTATTGIYTYGHTLSLHDALPTSWRTDAARLGKGNIEGAALLEWFLDRHFTLLGHETWMRDGTTRAVLGIARNQQAGPMLAEASRHLALAWFEKGGEPPLLLKSNLISTVHRAVPLDLAVVPIIENGKIARSE